MDAGDASSADMTRPPADHVAERVLVSQREVLVAADALVATREEAECRREAAGLATVRFERGDAILEQRIRDGIPLPQGGFDVILGNPPWEMLRGEGAARAGVRLGALRVAHGVRARAVGVEQAE